MPLDHEWRPLSQSSDPWTDLAAEGGAASRSAQDDKPAFPRSNAGILLALLCFNSRLG